MGVFGVEMGFIRRNLNRGHGLFQRGKMDMNKSLDFYVITIGGRNARK